MKIGRPAARYLSEIVADADLDMDGHKLIGLSAPADQNDSLRYGQAEIRNAEIALAAEIVLSKLVDTYLLPTVMTTRGDVTSRAAEYPVRIPAGAQGTVFTMGPDDPGWVAPGVAHVIKVKPADQIVNNSEVLINDVNLVLAVGANEIWHILLFMKYISESSTPDIDYAFVVPAGGTIGALTTWLQTDSLPLVNITAEVTIVPETVSRYTQLAVYYFGGGTAGNVQLKWAQHIATAEDTKMEAGSFMLCHRIA